MGIGQSVGLTQIDAGDLLSSGFQRAIVNARKPETDAASPGKCGHNLEQPVIYYARIGGNAIFLKGRKP
jgi:hypothetical protein